MENFEITSGPLPGSEKIYVTGSRSDIRVPMRKIKLSPTVDLDGSKIENEDVVVYDTSGPYTDTNYTVDLQKGLPKLRENWIEERQDTVKLEGLSSEYGRMRQEDKSLDSLRFEHVNTHPRIAIILCPSGNHYPGNGVYRYPGKSIGRPNPGKI
jgi:phosphomethylpyrimidine synthase